MISSAVDIQEALPLSLHVHVVTLQLQNCVQLEGLNS